MFDDKEYRDQDLLMKSILENGQEEIPGHIWNDISDELDIIARRRKVTLWWRRAAVSAAAAAVILGVVMNRPDAGNVISEESSQDLIAVIEESPTPSIIPDSVATVEEKARIIADQQLTAQIILTEDSSSNQETEQEPSITTPQLSSADSEQKPVSVQENRPQTYIAPKNNTDLSESFDDIWEEDERKDRKRHTSFTISGITGSNNPNDRARSGALRQPSYSKAPTRTSIAESSEKNTYGIPISIGAGIKVSLSEKWSVGGGLEYTLLSRKFYGTYIKVNENGGIDHSTYSDIRNDQHYIGIPVNAFYNILSNSYINFYAYAGGTIERCISDSYHLINTSIVHKENVNGMQFSANVGLGVEFMVGRYVGLYVDPRLRYYFHGNQPKSIRTEQPLMAGVEIGMRILL